MSLTTHCPHIELIELGCTTYMCGQLATGERCYDVVINDTDFTSFMSVVPRVDHLVLRSADFWAVDHVPVEENFIAITRNRTCRLETFHCGFSECDLQAEFVETFVRHCPAMTSLIMANISYYVSDDLIRKLPQYCPNIQTLILRNGNNSEDAVIHALRGYAAASKLTCIHHLELEVLTDAILPDLIELSKHSPVMKNISVSGSKVSKDAILQALVKQQILCIIAPSSKQDGVWIASELSKLGLHHLRLKLDLGNA